MTRFYRDIAVTSYPTGWWSALLPNVGFLRADTFDGVKHMIDDELDGNNG